MEMMLALDVTECPIVEQSLTLAEFAEVKVFALTALKLAKLVISASGVYLKIPR
jgi:hypothetical protein